MSETIATNKDDRNNIFSRASLDDEIQEESRQSLFHPIDHCDRIATKRSSFQEADGFVNSPNRNRSSQIRISTMFNIIRPHFQRFNQWIQMTPAEGQSSSIDTGGDCGGQHRHMYAAIVTDLVYHYGRGKKSCNALNGITIKVPVGTIYAILGPSGCGKTTLVHSLVGSIKPKSGYVKVFGEIPGSPRSLVPGPGVGYMPQEIGLFDEFTIKETLFFFGRLYRLKKDTIRNRIEFLISFLELPDKNCFVGKLSGGQKRRVSLASALVHKPPLLVLDEPTVGVDPVLRQSIWRHLRSLSSQEGITIIITTHYIDEAQYANTVAFMRHGILLEEGNPQQLIEQSGLNNLEEVFLALCNCKERKNLFDRKISCEKIQSSITIKSDFDRANSIETNLDNKAQNLHGNKFDDQPKTNRLLSSDNSKIYHSQTYRIQEYSGPIQLNEISYHGDSFTNRIRPQVVQRLLMKRNKILDHFARSSALLTKNFIRMWRNLPVMLFASLIPVLQCTLFFLCLGRNPYDIPISVYNGEIDPTYSNIFNRTKLDNLYSRLLLDEIDNHTINLVFVDTLEQGLMAVRSGQTKGLISFRPNFTRATFEKSVDFMSLTVENLEESFIDLHLDMSSQFHAAKIKEKIFEAYHKFSRKLLLENGYLPQLADSPVRISEPIMGNEDPTVTEFMAPGFIMSLSFFASIATAALTLVLERKDGLLERSLVSGVYPNEYIISHVITQTIVVIIQIILVLLMAFFIFHIPNRGPIFWISVLIVMQGVCGMAYGILISAIAKEENFTLAACMGSMFPQFLLSGVVWPVDTMPQFLIYLSTFLSQAKAIDAVRYMLYRGWDPFNHWDVSLGFIISASWTVVFLFIATILFNINKS